MLIMLQVIKICLTGIYVAIVGGVIFNGYSVTFSILWVLWENVMESLEEFRGAKSFPFIFEVLKIQFPFTIGRIIVQKTEDILIHKKNLN